MTSYIYRFFIVTLFALLATSCGSGGGNGSPPSSLPSWNVAELIETYDAGGVANPQIAIDIFGTAIAVWAQSDDTRDNIWANRYTPGGGWSTAELIETDNASSAGKPQVAFDSSGNAFAVWKQSDGTRDNIWANRYTADSGWGTAELIELNDAGDASLPQVALDATGSAIAIWSQYDGLRTSIWANRYTVSGGWGIANFLDSDDTGNASGPQIAIEPAGNAFAVWQQSNDTFTTIWANRYTASSGWSTAELIGIGDASRSTSPQIATDNSGNAIAVWEQNDGTRHNIRANRYTAVSGWGTGELIETDNAGNANNPQVAFDTTGNAIAVWQHSSNIWANRYTAGSGWNIAELIENNTGGTDGPQIAIDAAGNALAVWEQDDSTGNKIWANRYTTRDGWGLGEFLVNNNADNASYQQLAIDPAGNAFAISTQYDGTQYSIYVNRFE